MALSSKEPNNPLFEYDTRSMANNPTSLVHIWMLGFLPHGRCPRQLRMLIASQNMLFSRHLLDAVVLLARSATHFTTSLNIVLPVMGSLFTHLQNSLKRQSPFSLHLAPSLSRPQLVLPVVARTPTIPSTAPHLKQYLK